MKNRYASLVKDIVVFLFGNALAKLVQLILMPLYTSKLSPESFGNAELIINFSEFVIPIVTLCVYEGMFRFLIGNGYRQEEVITAGAKMMGVSVLVTVAACMALYWGERNEMYLLFSFLATARIVYMFALFSVRGKGKSTVFAAAGVINAGLLAMFSFFFLAVMRWDQAGYLFSTGAAYFLSGLYLIIAGGLLTDFRVKERSVSLCKSIVHFSWPLVFYTILFSLVTLSGRYLLLFFTDSAAVGIYSATIKYAAVINMIQQSVYFAFQLNNSRQFENKESGNYYSTVFRFYSMVVIAVGSLALCLVSVLADWTLKGDFNAAKQYLPVMIFSALIDCLFCFYKSIYVAFKKTKRTLPSIFIGAVINVVLCFVLIPKFKLWGVCIASLICNASIALYRVIDVSAIVRIRMRREVPIPLFLVSLQVLFLSNGDKLGGSLVIWGVIVAYYLVINRKEIQNLRIAYHQLLKRK